MMSVNERHPAVRRILKEVRELQKNPSCDYAAAPMESNIFEWHFTIRGPPDTDFDSGVYHGKIFLPADYPFKPVSAQSKTNTHLARFLDNVLVSLTFSSSHKTADLRSAGRYVFQYLVSILRHGSLHGQVKPAFFVFFRVFSSRHFFVWSVRMALIALRAFFPTPGEGAVGALDYPSEVRKKLALKSQTWTCSECGITSQNALPKPEEVDTSIDKELENQVAKMGFGVVKSKNDDGSQEPQSSEPVLPKASVDFSRQSSTVSELGSEQQSLPATDAKEEKQLEEKDESDQFPQSSIPPVGSQVKVQHRQAHNPPPTAAETRSETLWSIVTLSLIAAILAILIKKAWSLLLGIQQQQQQ
eukprot:TRINITY_DN8075_c0_g1_i4.p1 TRINITY_DN8075_c0_g1~~TRINITY_DN8075_c0_g1_i4.p1  ORF type:complete len:358 (-),score=61.95 TRINITY_DN8075_c0_g1_i4:45-1118(-)